MDDDFLRQLASRLEAFRENDPEVTESEGEDMTSASERDFDIPEPGAAAADIYSDEDDDTPGTEPASPKATEGFGSLGGGARKRLSYRLAVLIAKFLYSKSTLLTSPH